jgi:acetyl esterase/lipase
MSGLNAPGLMLDSGVVKHHAVDIATIDGYRPLQVDVYLPPTSVPTPQSAQPRPKPGPAILFIHGGGWALGSRRRFGRAFAQWPISPLELLALEGFAVICVDYRLSSEAIFPAQVHDCKAAIRWTRANAAELTVDPDRIMAWGESAGGHLSLMMGLTGSNEELNGQVGDHLRERSDVCGVVDWYGFTDLLASQSQRHPKSSHDHDAPDSFESRLLGGPLQSIPELARAASPLTYVKADVPPIQVHHGDSDLIVPYAQSEELVRALMELEVNVEFVTIPGADHFWIGAPDVAAIFDASKAFAKQVCGLA